VRSNFHNSHRTHGTRELERLTREGQKPGFFELFRLGPQIRPKTRFLRVAALKSSTGGQKPGFSRQYFVWARRFGQKPGFSVARGPETWFFATIFRLGPQIRPKTRFLRVARGPETGFFRDLSLTSQIRPKTRFLRVAALKSRNIRTEVLTTNITLPFIRALCRLA